MKKIFLYSLLLFATDAVAQNPANIVAKSLRFMPNISRPAYLAYNDDSSFLFINRSTGYTFRTNAVSKLQNGLTLTNSTGKLGGLLTENVRLYSNQTTSLTLDSLFAFIVRRNNIARFFVDGTASAMLSPNSNDALTLQNGLLSFNFNNGGSEIIFADTAGVFANKIYNTGLPATDSTLAIVGITASGLHVRTNKNSLKHAIGSYSQRTALSPVNGDEFFQTDDGRDAPAGKYYYLAGSWNLEPLRPEAFTEQNNEFFNVGANSESRDNIYYWSGNGGSISLPGGNVPGIARYQSGTSTNGFSGIYGGALGNPGGGYSFSVGATYFKLRITDLPTLSDGTNTYVFRAGIGTGLSGSDLSSGVWIEYNTGTSANWIMKAANFTSTTTTASSVAVTTGAHTLEFLVNAAGTSVEYWVDGTSLGTVTTNIPGSGNNINPVIQMVKLAGTTSRYVDVDYFKSWQRLTTARN